MNIAGILVILLCYFVITSASIYGVEIESSDEWWLRNIYLKFYSPSGKNYCIDYVKGEIYLERLNPLLSKEKVDTPYISFVSLNLKIYDIFFELQDSNYVPHIAPTKFVLDDQSTFVRHSLHSFVGPNNQVYKLSYNNISHISISAEEPPKILDHLQIRTFGPYSKWEHIYDFSKNGDLVTNLTLSPVEILPIRSIPLPEMDTSVLKDRDLLLIKYNTPSGAKYLITNDLNIASGNNEGVEPYITFIEPNGREYEIYFQTNGSGHIPHIVPIDNQNELKDLYGFKVTRLFSFVGPDKKQYRINHTIQSDPSLIADCEPNLSTDFQLTVLETSKYYRKYIKFTFSNQGKSFFDRVEEFDWTPLSEHPGIQLDEVEANSDVATSSFLTFYSPSGRIYYITPNDTNANIVVDKGCNKRQASYIKFMFQDGRTGHIYLIPGDDPQTSNILLSTGDDPHTYEIDPDNLNYPTTSFLLKSFVTPDKKSYKMSWMVENGIRIPFIDLTSQPKDPLDDKEAETLSITVMNNAREFEYHFTWMGEKLVGAYSRPLKRISSRVVASLIGK